MTDDRDIIVCRCEDVTLAELRECLADPHSRSFEAVKRLLRTTMGPCGGRSCREIILREIARNEGLSIEDVAPSIFRPPTTPLKLSTVAGSVAEDDDAEGGGGIDG